MTTCPECGRQAIARDLRGWRCECDHVWPLTPDSSWDPRAARAQNAQADGVELSIEIRRAEVRLIEAVLRAYWNANDHRACARERYEEAITQALTLAMILADLTGYTLGSRYGMVKPREE